MASQKEKVEVQPGADSPVPESAEETAAAVEKTALAEADAEVIAAQDVHEEEAERETGPILSVKDVHRSFPVGGGEIQVLKGIDMEVLSGQLVMLKGRSGSGKTTLLNMLGGLDQPTSGEIWFRGQPLHELNDDKRTLLRRNQIGFIFQAYALLPLLSAWENVELSLRMAGVPPQEWKPRVKHCLELVGLGKRMFHRPFELSGANSSGWPSPKRSPIAQSCCWRMNQRPTSIRKWEHKSWQYSRTSYRPNA